MVKLLFLSFQLQKSQSHDGMLSDFSSCSIDGIKLLQWVSLSDEGLERKNSLWKYNGSFF